VADSNHSQAHSHNFISGDEMLKASGQLAGICITGNELSGLKSPQKKNEKLRNNAKAWNISVH